MQNTAQASKALNISLWTAQATLAAFLVMGAVMKFMPIEKIAPTMPWMGQLPTPTIRLLGLVDLLGAAGLILPALLQIKPQLTVWSAMGVIALMVCACIFHISRGEASVIGFNIFCAALAAFIAWGRFKKAPISSR
jgi:uncharacterized membrane protein